VILKYDVSFFGMPEKMEAKIIPLRDSSFARKTGRFFSSCLVSNLLGQIRLMSYFVSSSGRGDSYGNMGILFGVVWG